MSELRFAVLGTGYWSHLQIPAWFEVKGAKLVSLYNRTVSKAKKVAEKFDIEKVYGDAEEMLQKEKLDFIDIITELPAHARFVLLAAKYRVPVICQKPMAYDFKTCQKMVMACKNAEIPFFIHENFRWQPRIRKVKEILDSGVIGKPFRANIQLPNYASDNYGLEDQPFLKTYEHFALFDMGSHLFDLARFFFGEANSLYCQTYRTVDYIGGEDVVSSLIRMGDVMVHCEICDKCNTIIFCEGKNGSLELDVSNELHIISEGKVTTIDCNVPPSKYPLISSKDEQLHGSNVIHSIIACNSHMLNSLKSGVPAETSGEDNLKTMSLVFSGIISANEDKVVKLN